MARTRPPEKFPPPIITGPDEPDRRIPLAKLAFVPKEYLADFFDDLSAVHRRYHVATRELDRNLHREAAPALRELLETTDKLRDLIDRCDSASSRLIREHHIDVHDRAHRDWLQLLAPACRQQLARARLGGRPTKHAQRIAIIDLVRLHGIHWALYAQRDSESFSYDDGKDRRTSFAAELRPARVVFARAALETFGVFVKPRTIRDVIAMGLEERSLEAPEALFDQRLALFEAYDAGHRDRQRRTAHRTRDPEPRRPFRRRQKT